MKDLFLLNPDIAFLNHGSYGAVPREILKYYHQLQYEVEREPVQFLTVESRERLRVARRALAAYLNADGNDLVYVTNTTFAINVIANSLSLGSGDEVLTTNHEYGAMDRTWRFQSEEKGFDYINQPISLPVTTHEVMIDELWQGVTDKTRVIFISHITSPTALIFPVEAICQRAREQGILTIVDGAHAPSQLPLNLPLINADFYVGNCHKWLCAPKGSAFLYAHKDKQDLLKPLVVSWGWYSDHPNKTIFLDNQEWQGTRDIAAFLTTPEAIRFQAQHDWTAVRAQCYALAQYARDEISALTGLPPIQTMDEVWFQQMVAMPLPKIEDTIALELKLFDDYDIEVPIIPFGNQTLVRVSAQGYNSQGDVDRLVNALKAVM